MHSSEAEVAYHLSVLQAKIDEFAERVGVPAVDRFDLRTTLAALPWPDRRRLGIVLEGARVQADGPALQGAVSLILRIAAEVWTETHPFERAEDLNPGIAPQAPLTARTDY